MDTIFDARPVGAPVILGAPITLDAITPSEPVSDGAVFFDSSPNLNIVQSNGPFYATNGTVSMPMTSGQIVSSHQMSNSVWDLAAPPAPDNSLLAGINLETSTGPKYFAGPIKMYDVDWDRVKGLKNVRYTDDKLIADELNVAKLHEGDTSNILTQLFSPLLCKTIGGSLIFMQGERERVKDRLKVGANPEVLKVVQDFWDKGFKFMVAGGKAVNWLTGEVANNDFDIFFTNEKDMHALRDGLKLSEKWNVVEKPHVIEYTHKDNPELQLQLICKTYASAEHCISEFDFKCCAVAIDNERVYWVKGALQDIQKKLVRFMNIIVRRTQFIRIQKYLDKGYNIAPADWAIASIGYLMSIDSMNPNAIHDYIVQRENYDHSTHTEANDECYNEWLQD